VAREQAGPAEQAEEEQHEGVGNLLGIVVVNVDEAEAKVGGAASAALATRSGEPRQSRSLQGRRRRCAACGRKARDRSRTARDGSRTAAADLTRPITMAEAE
jgi:hypothetical protein